VCLNLPSDNIQFRDSIKPNLFLYCFYVLALLCRSNLKTALVHVFGEVMAKGTLWRSSSQPPPPSDIFWWFFNFFWKKLKKKKSGSDCEPFAAFYEISPALDLNSRLSARPAMPLSLYKSIFMLGYFSLQIIFGFSIFKRHCLPGNKVISYRFPICEYSKVRSPWGFSMPSSLRRYWTLVASTNHLKDISEYATPGQYSVVTY